MRNRGYQQYKQQSVSTMTNGEMLILLYDECIKRLTMAEYTLDKKEYDIFEESVERVENIIKYLSAILDRKYSISQDLYRMYDYFLYELSRLRAGRKKEIIADIKPMIVELRDSFKEADKLQANQKKSVGNNL